MSERWNFYFPRINDKLAAVFLDLGLRGSAPDAKRPHLLVISTALRLPREDGLSAQDEFETLNQIEDFFVQELCAKGGALNVGRVTTDGHRDWFFYAKDQSLLQNVVAIAAEKFPAYKFKTVAKLDEKWSHYLDFLYPSEEELQCIKNAETLEVLQKNGDDPAHSRPVTHWTYFSSESDRQAFVDKAGALGFKLQSMNKSNELKLQYCAVLERPDTMHHPTVNGVTIQLFRLAREYNGDYDGFETRVVRAAK
jgi:uncharacterized protein (TIGR01619 family)